MANNDRDRRLLDASVLHDAITALSKVREEQRIEFIHDRMMSAIDDICKAHQKGAAKERFTASQVAILKDIIFHVIYVLDPKTRPSRGFARRLWDDIRSQTPLKQVGIFVGVIVFVCTSGYGAFQAVAPWVVQTYESFRSSPAAPAKMSGSTPQSQSAPSPPSGMVYPDVAIRNTAYGNQSNAELKATSSKLGQSLKAFEKTRRETLNTISNSAELSIEVRRHRLTEYEETSNLDFRRTLLPEVRDVQIELVKRNDAKASGSSRIPLTVDAHRAIYSGQLSGPSPLETLATYLQTLSDKL